MQIPKIESYNNSSPVEVRNLGEFPKLVRYTMLMTDRDKLKYIKKLEKIVRSSQEYKEYVAYLKAYIDMTKCTYFVGVSGKDSKRVSIEIHHEPFTLFDITQIVLEEWLISGKKLNSFKISEEIIKLHFTNKVGLIPLSVTVHQLVHSGKIFIPLQLIKGRFLSFLEKYGDFISEELKTRLEIKLKMSKELESQNLSILEKKYVYLEVDGMVFPETLDEIVSV